MSVAGTSTIIAGIIIFLIGYWFLGKSYGQNDCKDIPDTNNVNYGGGIAGIVIGIILMIIGLIINLSATTDSTTSTTSSYYEPTTASI